MVGLASFEERSHHQKRARTALDVIYQQPNNQPIPSKKKRKSISDLWRSGPVGKAGVIAMIVVALLLCAACSGIVNAVSHATQAAQSNSPVPTDTPAPTATTDPTTLPAYQLAGIDANGTPDSATVAKYQKVLDTLHDKTGESEQNISDETVAGQEILAKANYIGDDKLITLMNAVNASITKSEHQKYTETLAALITLMQNGK